MYDGLSESQRKKIASIVDFYFDHIKTYTDEYLHELLLHFSTLISTISCAANLENNMECSHEFLDHKNIFTHASFESLFPFFLSVKYYNPKEILKMYELTFSVPDTVLIEFSMLLFSFLCFKEELTNSEIVLRIIVEFLFLTDILYIEFNKCKNTERVKSIENKFQTFLDSSYPCHHTVHEDVVSANLSLQHISLKTSNLIEISVIVETFSDQLFLDKLNTAIITKLKKTVNSTSNEGNMREFILYIVKTEKINNVPSTEKLQKEVHGEPSNILHNEIQEDVENEGQK
ncbi:hypothetical protein CWI38_1201p0010 [Hamiltosporidium tvaerminnensis]|uniref:Uncharacterized protein n=1 Tax=Hamiltosporidium tvaerminnensis TaxID=1176355 RepID=A0A4Q9LT40_9MICR|nr:hypothetical protein CWI38_1201p0010 [Hamiltosporidium tvaerminnensis]